MMKYLLKIGNIIQRFWGWLLPVIAAGYIKREIPENETLVSFIDQVVLLSIAPHLTQYFGEYVILFSGILAWGLLLLGLKRYRRFRGHTTYNKTEYGNISYRSLVSLLNPVRFYSALNQIHEMYHQQTKGIKIIKENAGVLTATNPLNNKTIRDQTALLLEEAKILLDYTLSDDVAVHVKLFKGRVAKGGSEININETTLAAYERYPSVREGRKKSTGKIPARGDSENFKILLNETPIEKLKATYEKDSGDTNDKINTGYNYVFQGNEHFFVCNDLDDGEKKNYFYSNSKNYKDFYSSLAVFPILPPVAKGKPTTTLPCTPFGVFVVDSYSKNRMDRMRLQIVGGYVSHRLFDFFTDINDMFHTKS